MVHRGQADVLVGPTVTGHEVCPEHLVVVGPRVAVVDRVGVGVRRQRRRGPAQRRRVVGDVVEERVSGLHGPGGGDRGVQVALHEAGGHAGRGGGAGHHHQREPVRAAVEVPVGVGHQQRHVEHVQVAELDAEHGPGLLLDVVPGGQAADGFRRLEQAAGLDRTGRRGRLVLAQEDLVRGVGGVGLGSGRRARWWCCGPRCRGGPVRVGGAGQQHRRADRHVVRRGGRVAIGLGEDQRVVGGAERHHHAARRLGHQVQAGGRRNRPNSVNQESNGAESLMSWWRCSR